MSGANSKWMGNGELAKRYERSSKDPELMNMRRPVAVCDMVVRRRAKLIEERDSTDFRMKAKALMQKVRSADDQEKALDELEAHLRRGADEEEGYAQLESSAERLAGLQERYAKLALQRQIVMNQQHGVAVMRRWCDITTMLCPRGTKDNPVTIDYDVGARVVGAIHAEILVHQNGAPLLEEPEAVLIESKEKDDG